MKIVKRDGRLVEFDQSKIKNAVLKSFVAVDGELTDYAITKAENIAAHIESLQKEERLTVEQIQDLVEHGLMSTRRKDVAKAYITYRHERTKEREKRGNTFNIIENRMNAKNVENSNANIDEFSFGGRIGAVSEDILKQYALDHCMSPLARENHILNMIYTHDLGSYASGMHNCMSIPYDPLLANGFNTRQTDVRPAKSVSTMFQLIAVIAQLQSLQQFGGVSATHLDWTAVPYVRMSFAKHFLDGVKWFSDNDVEYDKEELSKLSIESELYKEQPKAYEYALEMTIKETQQAVEGMYHNLNTLQSRSGNQLPFTSINYGTCTLSEGRIVIKALLEGSIKGVGKFHKTSIFPCGIFQCMKGVNRHEGDPNYDLFRLALKSTATRLYPNYANVDWSGNAGYDINDPSTYFSTMGCRTANGWDINGLGQQKDGRGNICPVTIIMPTLAMMAKEQEGDILENFIHLLAQKIDEARIILMERFDYICGQDPKAASFMYENNIMAGYIPEEGIRSALKHGTLAIGQLGLAETLQILVGEDHTSEFGMECAKRIEKLFQSKCADFKEQYRLNFGVYYTPAESLCYTAMKKFKEQYGEIPNVSDKEFFTNSMHVPVWKEMSPFEKIDIESQLTGYSSAGCITYVELEGGIKDNIDALEQIVNYAMDKDIPYFAVNVPNDMCTDCGYTGEINDECPMCSGQHIRRLRRVTGYLTGDYTTAFNLGKQDEVRYRVKHM